MRGVALGIEPERIESERVRRVRGRRNGMNYSEQGGTAFPVVFKDGHWLGMSLRDWFAGQALQGILSANPVLTSLTEENVDRVVARECYRAADAMLKEMNKPCQP